MLISLFRGLEIEGKARPLRILLVFEKNKRRKKMRTISYIVIKKASLENAKTQYSQLAGLSLLAGCDDEL